MNHIRRNGEFVPPNGGVGCASEESAKGSGPLYGNNNINSSVSNLIGVSPINNSQVISCANSTVVATVIGTGDGGGVGSASDLFSGANRRSPYRSCDEDVGNGVNVGEVIVMTRPRSSHGGGGSGQDSSRRRRRHRRPSESEISSRTSHSMSTSSSSRYSGSGTPCHRGSSCSEAETSSTTSSETESVEADLPYPGFPAISLKYLTQTTKPRNWCLRLITNPYPFSKTFLI